MCSLGVRRALVALLAAAVLAAGVGDAARPPVAGAVVPEHARSGYAPSLTAIHAPRVWKRTTGRGVVVAVIDSGVAGDVANLRGRVLPGVDLVEPHRRDGWADQMLAGGHGTGVASIIAGTGRAVPVHGIAPGVQILPVRIVNAHGHAPDRRVARAIVWATQHGADVINLSVGTPAAQLRRRDRHLQHAAVRYAVRHGVTIVAGAGNNGPHNSGRFYPAAFREVIAVGGSNLVGTAASSFSNRGRWVDVVAPSVDVWNTNSDGTLGIASGTSFAGPAVAALAALMLALDPDLTPSEIRRILMSSAADLGTRGRDRDTGAGLVNAPRAVGGALRRSGRLTGPQLREPPGDIVQSFR